jgi:D-apiose dehydrogenase
MSAALASMLSRPRIGVVGAGYFSQFHLRGWQKLDAHVAALCDVDLQRAKQQAERFGVATTYSSVRDMLAATDIDVLDVAVPPAYQAEVLSAALDARVPAICQKPFACSIVEAQTLVRRAQDAKVPLLIHENFRFMPWFREMKRLIDAGMLGALYGAMFRLRPGDGQGANAYLDRQPYFQTMNRFLVVETAIHFIDTFRYLMGEIVSVTARLRRINPNIAGEDAGIVVFEFESGATATLDANRCNDHVAENTRRTMGEMWLEGERGCLRLDGDARLWWKPHRDSERKHEFDTGSADALDFGGGACAALQQSALDAILRGAPAENTALDYLKNIRIQEAIYQSHETGLRIDMRVFTPPTDPLIPSL